MNLDTLFCRKVLQSIHNDVRKAFPEIKSLRHAASATTSMRGQWFVQIVTPDRPTFNFDCRAYNAADAKCKAWTAFLLAYATGCSISR